MAQPDLNTCRPAGPGWSAGRIGWLVLGLVVAGSLGILAARERQEKSLAVDEVAENIRDAPDGEKIGSLFKGTEIEKLGQQGQWVHFRIEGWIWGPSLKGFVEEETQEAAPAGRLLLQDYLPKVKRLITETYGVFYGLTLDQDFSRLVVRFRVRDISREALERRQMAVQAEVLSLLEGKVEFASIRVETNRPDGAGQVGVEMAETPVVAIRRLGSGPVEEWKAHTRISVDGGETWNR